MAYKKAHFKTGYLQREIPMSVIVAEKLEVGALCTYDASTNKITGATAKANGSFIVAQSDMTMNQQEPGVDMDKYDPSVAASATPKHVALFLITDATDVVVEA
jgi:hypothetical protein